MASKQLEIPKEGVPHETLEEILDGEMRAGDIDPWSGRSFGLCYLAGREHAEFVQRAYAKYFISNALNPQAFPSLQRMENEVVAMAAWMLHGGRTTTGTMTTGGTESILMAMKTYRDQAREKRGITTPEMILPVTAHPAFEKAAHYFDIKPVHVPLTADYRVDVDLVQEALTGDTVVLVGSAPCYPYGVIDPIEALAALARDHKIGCHVDGCLGGFLLPWVEKAGYPISHIWDFRVKGVTSISADLHKYGYAAKPASVVLYKNDRLRKYQFYVYSDWVGGIYGSPSLLGSRPGGAIAAAWASIRALGQDGYVAATRDVMETAKRMIAGINAVPELRVMGEPDAAVYAYTFHDDVDLDFFKFVDFMEAKGWFINRMQDPPAAHHMTSRVHVPIVDAFLADLLAAIADLRAAPPTDRAEGQAAMYGMMATFDDRAKIDEIVRGFLLQTYKYSPKKRDA